MDKHQQLKRFIQHNPDMIGKVVYFDAKRHHLLHLDLTNQNTELSAQTLASTFLFSEWIFAKLKANKCKYGIGGYLENRTVYTHSALFNTAAGSRSLHLGVDIWGDAGTVVYAPMKGKVHSFQNNNNPGDYGYTVILEHDLDGLKLYSLYGHLNEESLLGLHEGLVIEKGETVGELGTPEENGNWPPHLHFQLMFDMQGHKGDYPGVCLPAEKDLWLQNIADPDLILQFPAAVVISS
jgi:hypothetical protein